MDTKLECFLKNFSIALNEIYRFGKRKCRRMAGFLIRSQTIRSYLRTHQVHKLQIGAGTNILDGWLNTNESSFSSKVIFLEATRPFPFDNSTFDYIFSEHQIEHLSYKEGLFMLHECSRVLKPGGKIRVATPDLDALIGLRASEKNELQKRYIKWIVDTYFPDVGIYKESFVINNAFQNWEHRFLYDRETLKDSMERAGFINIAFYSVGQSDEEILRGIEHHGKAICNEEINSFETMVLEGKRPG